MIAWFLMELNFQTLGQRVSLHFIFCDLSGNWFIPGIQQAGDIIFLPAMKIGSSFHSRQESMDKFLMKNNVLGLLGCCGLQFANLGFREVVFCCFLWSFSCSQFPDSWISWWCPIQDLYQPWKNVFTSNNSSWPKSSQSMRVKISFAHPDVHTSLGLQFPSPPPRHWARVMDLIQLVLDLQLFV